MRKYRRVDYKTSLRTKSIFLQGINCIPINISCEGVLIHAVDIKNTSLINPKNIYVELHLENSKIYREFASVVRNDSTTVALKFHHSIPFELISDREYHRLIYNNFYDTSPCLMLINGSQCKVIEISHPNILVIENRLEVKEGQSVDGTVSLLYDQTFDFAGTIYSTYPDRIIINTEKNISNYVVNQELGLYQNFPDFFKLVRDKRDGLEKKLVPKSTFQNS